MAEHIGAKIFKLRMRQGLTQAKLAKGICDRSHISMIEAGRCTPSISLLEKIASRLQLTLPDLLGKVTPPSREVSFSFDLLIDHLESLLEEGEYYDGSVLIRKHLRHPNIAESPSKLAILYRFAGVFEAMKKNYDRAEVSLIKAKEYAEQCRDQEILVEVQISLGTLQNFMTNYEQSELIYNQTLSFAPKELPLATQTKLHYGLGLALQGQGKMQQALRILKSRLEQLVKSNSMFLFGEIITLIAACYEKMNVPHSAIPYYEKVAAYYTFKGNTKQASMSYRKIAACYQALDRMEEFQAYSKLAGHAEQVGMVQLVEENSITYSTMVW
ncbi:MAG: helix-turn-helix domain-containing protein [Tumebacillaceae bacterium]